MRPQSPTPHHPALLPGPTFSSSNTRPRGKDQHALLYICYTSTKHCLDKKKEKLNGKQVWHKVMRTKAGWLWRKNRTHQAQKSQGEIFPKVHMLLLRFFLLFWILHIYPNELMMIPYNKKYFTDPLPANPIVSHDFHSRLTVRFCGLT